MGEGVTVGLLVLGGVGVGVGEVLGEDPGDTDVVGVGVGDGVMLLVALALLMEEPLALLLTSAELDAVGEGVAHVLAMGLRDRLAAPVPLALRLGQALAVGLPVPPPREAVGDKEGEAVGEGLRDARGVLLVEEDTVEVRWVVRVALPVVQPERAEEGVEDSVAPEALARGVSVGGAEALARAGVGVSREEGVGEVRAVAEAERERAVLREAALLAEAVAVAVGVGVGVGEAARAGEGVAAVEAVPVARRLGRAEGEDVGCPTVPLASLLLLDAGEAVACTVPVPGRAVGVLGALGNGVEVALVEAKEALELGVAVDAPDAVSALENEAVGRGVLVPPPSFPARDTEARGVREGSSVPRVLLVPRALALASRGEGVESGAEAVGEGPLVSVPGAGDALRCGEMEAVEEAVKIASVGLAVALPQPVPPGERVPQAPPLPLPIALAEAGTLAVPLGRTAVPVLRDGVAINGVSVSSGVAERVGGMDGEDAGEAESAGDTVRAAGVAVD